MKNKKTSNKSIAKKSIVLMLALVVVVGVTFLIMKHLNSNNDNQKDAQINFDPPTKQEIKAGQNIKEDNERENEQKNQENPSIPTQRSIFITEAEQEGQDIVVRSYVEGIIRDGGTCTFTFTSGAHTLTKTTEGLADAKHTVCRRLSVKASEFPTSGTYKLVITYENLATSEPENVEVTK